MATKENQRFLLVYKVMNDIVYIIWTTSSEDHSMNQLWQFSSKSE
jgi:hypothetical protein